MKPTLILASLLFAAPSFADAIGIPVGQGLDLRRSVIVASAEADVRPNTRQVAAPHGIRRESGETGFEQLAPLLLGEPFIVRDTDGDEHRLLVRAIIRDIVWVDVEPVRPPRVPPAEVVAGHYSLAEWSIDGKPTTARFPDLVLSADGTFRLGGASGQWSRGNRSLTLDGHYRQWGPATVDRDARTVTFHFRRGQIDFRVVMERNPSAQLASRTE